MPADHTHHHAYPNVKHKTETFLRFQRNFNGIVNQLDTKSGVFRTPANLAGVLNILKRCYGVPHYERNTFYA